MKRKLSLLFVTIILTGCFKTTDRSQWLIYQPDMLVLSKDQVIETLDGQYVVQNEREIWHSTKTVNELEERLLRYSK